MKSVNVSADEAKNAVEKLTSAEFLQTVKMLADPALRAALTKLAERPSFDILKDTENIQDAVKELVSPRLAAALERFNSPAVQDALRKASEALLAAPGKT